MTKGSRKKSSSLNGRALRGGGGGGVKSRTIKEKIPFFQRSNVTTLQRPLNSRAFLTDNTHICEGKKDLIGYKQ